MTSTIHHNSLIAYATTEPSRTTIQDKIMDLMDRGVAMTDRQIATMLGLLDTQYRPRITELVEMGKLHEVGSVICPVTNKRVRVTRKFLLQTKQYSRVTEL